MDNLKLLAGVIIGTLILIVGVAFVFSGQEQQQAQVLDPIDVRGDARNVRVLSAAGESENDEESSVSAELKEGMVEIVEFSDFQCPACAASEPVVEQVLEKYGDKVALIYRHFPLDSIHKQARVGAIAAEVAGASGKFFEYHDVLFERQDEWTVAEDVNAVLVSYAEELGLDGDEFRAGMEDEKFANLVNVDAADGRRLGINATPTFFVGGKKVSVTELESEIEAQL